MVVLKEISDVTPEKISSAFFSANVGMQERKDEKNALLALVGRHLAIQITDNAVRIANDIAEKNPEVVSDPEFAKEPFREYLESHPELLPGGNRMPQ